MATENVSRILRGESLRIVLYLRLNEISKKKVKLCNRIYNMQMLFYKF